LIASHKKTVKVLRSITWF